MKIAFPNMGLLNIPVKAFLEKLGHKVILNDVVNKKMVEVGSRYAPEGICVPYKAVLGNFVDSLEKGAELLVNAGHNGPCRFGYYSPLIEKSLKKLGYDFEFMDIDYSSIKDIFFKFRKLKGKKSYFEFIEAWKFGWKKLTLLENMDRDFNYFSSHSHDHIKYENLFEMLKKKSGFCK